MHFPLIVAFRDLHPRRAKSSRRTKEPDLVSGEGRRSGVCLDVADVDAMTEEDGGETLDHVLLVGSLHLERNHLVRLADTVALGRRLAR